MKIDMEQNLKYTLVWSIDFINGHFQAEVDTEISGIECLYVRRLKSKDIKFLIRYVECVSYRMVSNSDHYNRLVDKLNILYELTENAIEHIQNRNWLSSMIYNIGYLFGFYKNSCTYETSK